jgi:cyclopropane fatty-acyl-phospholipid synthase-like methyltransferase
VTRPKAAERLVWAVDTLAVQHGDRLLEIGCGHGVAVSLVCEKLDGGHIIAIDRSHTMIEMATKRNAAHVAEGVASFQAVALHQADLRDARFDKIFAIHVPVFARGEPARELEIVRDHLAPGGHLYLVYQPLVADQAEATAETLSTVLTGNGFTVSDILVHDLSASRVTCVVSRPR